MIGTLPAVPSSVSPTKATGCFSRSWFAHAEDCSGDPSVTQVSSCSGRPAAPPSSGVDVLHRRLGREPGVGQRGGSALLRDHRDDDRLPRRARHRRGRRASRRSGPALAAELTPPQQMLDTVAVAATVTVASAVRTRSRTGIGCSPSSLVSRPITLNDKNRSVKRKRFTGRRSFCRVRGDERCARVASGGSGEDRQLRLPARAGRRRRRRRRRHRVPRRASVRSAGRLRRVAGTAGVGRDRTGTDAAPRRGAARPTRPPPPSGVRHRDELRRPRGGGGHRDSRVPADVHEVPDLSHRPGRDRRAAERVRRLGGGTRVRDRRARVRGGRGARMGPRRGRHGRPGPVGAARPAPSPGAAVQPGQVVPRVRADRALGGDTRRARRTATTSPSAAR